MGKEYYDSQLRKNAEIDKSDFVNVSSKLDKSFLNNWTTAQEATFSKKDEVRKTLLFTQNQLFAGISNLVFPYELRTPQNMELIMAMADLYELPLKTVREVAFSSYDDVNNVFDEERFKQRIRKQRTTKKIEKHPYDVPCAQFLAKFQNSGNISDSHAKLLETIKNKYNLSNEVINVLVEYVLKNYQMDLNRHILDTIASRLDRLKINDYQSALTALQSKGSSVRTKDNNLPEWIVRNPQSKDGKIEAEDVPDEEYQSVIDRLSKNGS